MKRLLTLVLLLLAACGPAPTTTTSPSPPVQDLTPMPTPDNPYAPKAGDAGLQRGPAFVDEAGVLTLESFPPQFQLHISGSLPDPCHELRIVVSPPDDRNNIAVEVYSVVDPSVICIQVIKAFSGNVNLGSYPAGHYTVTVNDEAAGEFDA